MYQCSDFGVAFYPRDSNSDYFFSKFVVYEGLKG